MVNDAIALKAAEFILWPRTAKAGVIWVIALLYTLALDGPTRVV